MYTIIHIILFTQWQRESKRRKGENYMKIKESFTMTNIHIRLIVDLYTCMLCHFTADQCSLARYKVSFHSKYFATAHSKLDNTLYYFTTSSQMTNKIFVMLCLT